MSETVLPGTYQHYKGNFYTVIGVATHSEEGTKLVVYRPEYGDRAFWVRPLSMFKETVEVNGRQVPRFRYIDEHNPD